MKSREKAHSTGVSPVMEPRAAEFHSPRDVWPRVLVIGYGNPLRGDDGLGWEAAERLMRKVRWADMEVMTRHQLTPELCEPISLAELVIFIDAAEDLPAGKIATRKLSPASLSLCGMSHDLGPEMLLGAARVFYGYAPPAYLFTIGGQFWGYREGLSANVRSAVVRLVDQIEHLIVATLRNGQRQDINA